MERSANCRANSSDQKLGFSVELLFYYLQLFLPFVHIYSVISVYLMTFNIKIFRLK